MASFILHLLFIMMSKIHRFGSIRSVIHFICIFYSYLLLMTLRFFLFLQAEFLDPAVKGTLSVLQACVKSQSVKRVILTSSMAAVTFSGRPLTPETVIDETWFSDPEHCKELKSWYWYVLSKTLAEDAAWKFAKANNIHLVTINPGLVIGPLLQPVLNTSAARILNVVNGTF
ncbi:hypothetical protein HN51_036116 [Arachis hypogaea]